MTLAEQYQALLPILKVEADLLHAEGWSSGYGWDEEWDWWWKDNHQSPAYENGTVMEDLTYDLKRVRRVILTEHYENLLTPFMKIAAGKLADNHHKGGWDGMDPLWGFKRMVDESSESIEAILQELHPDEVAKEAADVMNFAFIMSESYRQKWADKQDAIKGSRADLAITEDIQEEDPDEMGRTPRARELRNTILGDRYV